MIRKICVVSVVIILFSFTSYCYEIPKTEDYISSEIMDILPSDCINCEGEYPIIDYSAVLSEIAQAISDIFLPILKSFFSIIAVIIICATFKVMGQGLQSKNTLEIFNYISVCCIAIILYQNLNVIWEDLSSLFEKIYSFMNTVTPSVTLLYALGGNVVSAAVSQSMTSIILTVFSDIFYHTLKPILQICFGFCIVSCVTGSINLKPISAFVRRIYTTVLVAIITLMTAVMSFQTILNSNGDSLAAKTVKLVSATGIPIVGGALGEAISGLGAGIGVIRSSFGVLCVIALLLMILPVFIGMWLKKASLSFSNAVCAVFSLEREAELIGAASELINFAIALCVSASVLFIANITIFSKCAVAAGG